MMEILFWLWLAFFPATPIEDFDCSFVDESYCLVGEETEYEMSLDMALMFLDQPYDDDIDVVDYIIEWEETEILEEGEVHYE